MTTMRALVFAGIGQPMLEERPRPQILAATDAVVKMVKGTICGTDLHILKGDVATCAPGRILGHEGTGVVHSVGASVTTFKPGDRVIVSCITSCMSCEFCRKGLASHCVDGGWVLGHTIDGTQAEYVRVPHADGSLHHLISGASEAAQAMCSDVLPTGFECGVLSGRVKPGSSVAIVGGGPIGLGIVLTAQLYSPSSLIMITRDPNRLKIAASLGVTHCITFGPSAAEEVMALTGGRGVDTVIEAAGVPGTFDLCQELVAVGGTIANLGVHGCKVDLHLDKLWHKNITITTSLVDTVSTGMLLKLMNSGKINTDVLITHTFSFAKMLDAYSTFGAAAEHKAIKVIIDF
ncbi:alcohol dehydrogenase GroES domain-containing protein [Mycena albidolilacea]|uniref:Alcohol dehydrogenase GroES domain-containing protein n=1 Tax=Mycena albidolilacea TaxID=1033008 RepID=A0AAD7EMT0_9AGAR|nr:alcohol dehydrogenase GroES domain-containing protein [Mycena albidolilacea]